MNNKIITLLCFTFSFLCVNAQWNKITSGTSKNINAVTFSNSNTVVAVGDSGLILRSSNAGNSFTIVSSATLKHLNDVFFLDANNGFAVGDGGTILKTINAGVSWSAITSNTSNDLMSIDIRNNIGLITGSNGTILKSVNNGATWTPLTPFTIYLLNKVRFVTNDVAVISGNNGLLLKSIDAGNNWTTENSSANKNINDFAFYPNATDILAVGINGLQISTDTSFSSISESTISAQWLNAAVAVPNTDTCFTVGKNATVLFTANGSNWNTITISSTADFNDISFVSNTVGIIVGSKGNIFKTTTGGASLTTQEIEKLNFTFYPNPSTSFIYITGDIEEQTQLKIYNTSGQILLEENVQGNSILVNHNLPSGMYLLQMSSNKKVGSTVFVVE
jgi:photosystem II stability/assembly factor-like uncharacterized protein